MNESGKKLTSKEAARVLSVSEASIKRWADGGLLPMEKTVGGHRRFRPEDVAVFKRANFAQAAEVSFQSPQLAARRSKPLRRRPINEALIAAMFDALVAGEDEAAAQLLINSHLEGRSVAVMADSLLSKPMQKIGDLWHQGDLTVAQEHIATRTVLSALQKLKRVLEAREANNRLAVCCSTEEDFHELPVQITELIFREAGWKTINLGTHTPFYALTETIIEHRPQLVCVASTKLHNLDRAVREYKELRQAAKRVGAALALGGTGFDDQKVQQRFPAELYADKFQQLEKFIAALEVKAQPTLEAGQAKRKARR
jgi:excisionase family DNA binding protein